MVPWTSPHVAFHLRSKQTITEHIAGSVHYFADTVSPALLRRDGFSGAGSGANRDPDSSDSGSSSGSGSGSHGGGGGGGGGGDTLPIVLGVILPIVAVGMAFLFIWRRNLKKQRAEEANDKHGSLDFGLGEVHRKKGKKGKLQPEMVNEKGLGHTGGLSIEIDMGSPYFLPDDAIKHRPSFGSERDDPYRTATQSSRSDDGSRPPPSYNSRLDTASIYTSRLDDGSKTNLLRGASKVSRSPPPAPSTGASTNSSTRSSSPSEKSPLPVPEQSHSSNVARKPIGLRHRGNSTSSGSLQGHVIPEETAAALANVDNTTLPQTNFSRPKSSAAEKQLPAPPRTDSTSPPPRRTSKMASIDGKIRQAPAENSLDEFSTYADVLGIVQKDAVGGNSSEVLPAIQEPSALLDPSPGVPAHAGYYDDTRLSTQIRPLPPDDPADNAEQRANRIRSFYREYFDDSKGADASDANDYYEDYDDGYLAEAPIFDPVSGQFVLAGPAPPFAQPIGRRAMTPPPRGPGPYRGPHSAASSGQIRPHRARAYSTASARIAGPRGRPVKKRLAPPKPLANLPTPHLLKDDTAFNMADFAPPPNMRDMAAGRPGSPKAGSRPYSPTVRAHTPMLSPFADMKSMPSPHSLRVSSTFTGLDFAPPPRFKNDNASDKGSIRSGRSGITDTGLLSIRAGGNRLSRLPKDTVGTVDDLAATLKPTWNAGRE